MTRRRPGTLVAVIATVLVVGGCNEGGDPIQTQTPTRTTSSTSPAETKSVSADEQAVLDAYEAFYAALSKANADPPQSQVYLEPVATGAQFEQANGSIKATFLAGEETVGTPVLSPKVHSVEGYAAIVRDCQDTTEVIRRKIGTVDPLIIGRYPDSAETRLEMVDGAWKVAAVEFKEPASVFCP